MARDYARLSVYLRWFFTEKTKRLRGLGTPLHRSLGELPADGFGGQSRTYKMATSINQKIKREFLEAAKLLDDDNLEWSSDLDCIRKDLAKYLRERAEKGEQNSRHLRNVVERFIAD